MTGLIWNAVAIIAGVLCLFTIIALTCIAFIFSYSVIKAMKDLVKKGKKENNCDCDND